VRNRKYKNIYIIKESVRTYIKDNDALIILRNDIIDKYYYAQIYNNVNLIKEKQVN